MLTNDTENYELTVFRQEPKIWCEIFTRGIIYNSTDLSEIPEMYNDMVNFLCSNERTDSLAKSAVLHYQFEMIKPFEAHNVFWGRLIFLMILNYTGFKAITHLAYSEFLYEHRENYFKILSSTQGVGDFLRLIKYFLRGMLSSTEKGIKRVNNLEAVMLKDELKIRNSTTQVKCIYDIYAYFKRHLISDIKSIS